MLQEALAAAGVEAILRALPGGDHADPAFESPQFLAEARKLYPDARKVLLTAYADTEAAIESIKKATRPEAATEILNAVEQYFQE